MSVLKCYFLIASCWLAWGLFLCCNLTAQLVTLMSFLPSFNDRPLSQTAFWSITNTFCLVTINTSIMFFICSKKRCTLGLRMSHCQFCYYHVILFCYQILRVSKGRHKWFWKVVSFYPYLVFYTIERRKKGEKKTLSFPSVTFSNA